MKVILGLGNPGRDYENTRHNVGWMVLDHLADVWHFSAWRKDGEALTASGTVNGAATRLVKPLTFMNLSGQVLKPWLHSGRASVRCSTRRVTLRTNPARTRPR